MFNLFNRKELNIAPNKLRLPYIEKLTVVESLSIMLSSGIPILEALEGIEEDATYPKTKKVVQSITDSVQKGKSLAESFSVFPEVFDEIFINTVKAGEESGSLDKVLDQLADNLKKNEQIKSDVRAAMLYPAIVIGVLMLVLIVLIGFVIPRVAEIFERLNIPKPLPTQILLGSALFIKGNYLLIFGVLIILAILVGFLLSQRRVRSKIYAASFRVPIVGIILKYLDLARFSGTLALMLSSGIPIIKAVAISKTVVISGVTQRELEEVSHELTEGKSLADSMKKFKTFPHLMTRIIKTGEKTGTLDKVLSDLATYYQTKMSGQVKLLSTSLEPLLIVIIGIIVGAVILSIIAPIYQLIGQISPR